MASNPLVELIASFRTQTEGASQSTYVHEQRDTFVQALRSKSKGFPTDEELRVKTKLDGLVDLLLTEAAPRLVFLTGDAGDGKTAVCALLAARLGHELDDPIVTAGGWTILKDASELAEQADAEGKDLLSLVTACVRGELGTRLIVAINEGRLRRLVRSAELEVLGKRIVKPSLEALDDVAALAVDTASRELGVLVLNFRQRFVVRELVRGFVTSWTGSRHWEDGACGSCPAAPRCPILANVQDLRHERTVERIGDALVAVYFTGQRLPIRRIQAVLALALTGGLQCDRVIAAAPTTKGLQTLRHRFYDVLFAFDGHAVRPEPLCATLRPFDPGLESARTIDDGLLLALGQPDDVAPTLLEQPLPRLEAEALQEVRRADAGTAEEHGRRVHELGCAVRRWAWFAGIGGARPAWDRARALLEACATAHESATGQAEGDLLGTTIDGLNRLLGVAGSKRDRLSRHLIDPAGIREPSRAGLELDVGMELSVRLRRGPTMPRVAAAWLESCAGDLVLEAQAPPASTSTVHPRLSLDLRVVEALLRTTRGEASASALGPDRRRIARFMSQIVEMCSGGPLPVRVSVRTRSGRRRLETSAIGGTTKLAIHLEA